MSKKIEKYLNSDIWFNYQDFYKMVANNDYTTYVEIGVWKGHSISFLANEIKKQKRDGVKIYAVDLFEETYKWKDNNALLEQVPLVYDIYNKNLDDSKTRDMITDLKGMSWDMADHFEDGSVDFVFIDADHTYESVVKDINAWLPKVKKGGMISGHDYLNPCGVKQAVDELIGKVTITKGGVWYKKV